MGGSGGGGGAGAVSWPDYLQNTHSDWLTKAGTDTIATSMTETMDAATGNNPYAGLGVYSPTTESANMDYVVANLENLRNGFDGNWSGYVNTSLGLLEQIISSYGDFLVPNPQAAENILSEWVTLDSNGYEVIGGDWRGIEWQGWSLLEAGWTLPVTSMTSDIRSLWETPNPDTSSMLVDSWAALYPWIELVYISATNIKADWQDLEEWIGPTLVADLMIADNWQVLPTWNAPVLESDINISNNWQSLPAWVEPDPDADEDIKDNLANETYVADSTNQFGNVLDDQISSDVLPRFEAGMRDINAVMSSAFVIGRSIIEGMRDRDVAKYQADLRYKAFLQRDALLGQAYMQDDQLFAQSTLESNKINSTDAIEKSRMLSQSYMQNDQLNAQSTLEDNRVNAADTMEKSKALSQSYLQNDQLNAQSILEQNRVLAANTMELSKMLAQSHLQTDQLAAQSNIEQNKANVSYVLEMDRSITQSFLQYNQIMAADVDSKNKTLAGATMEEEKIHTNHTAQTNDGLIKIAVNVDQLIGSSTIEWNKARTSLLGQDNSIENQMINDRNKSLAEAYLNYDKVDSDNVKTRNVIAGDHMKHHATLAWQGASTMYDGQGLYMEVNKILSNVLVEANRMKYVMNKEWQDKTSEYDVAEGKWDLEVFQYGSNLLAAVSGGTGFTPGPTPGASALGGAFSGAAIGAKVSGNSAIGAGAGAVLGGIGGYLLGK